jgi:uncharacterized repeat protein (TIGR01451 family)
VNRAAGPDHKTNWGFLIMKSSVLLQSLAAACIAATASAASAQAIQLFSPVNVRVSTSGTSSSSPNIFNSTILNLSCPSEISAKISSSTDGTGNVLVDNYIALGVGTNATPTDICSNGTVEGDGQQNCFTSSYGSQAQNNGLLNQDPDNFVSTGGVPALDISSSLTPGPNQVEIDLVDTGGYLTSSTLYLVTNCSSAGVAGPGQVTGNPISASNPTAQQLAQNYSFNSTTNQQVQFTYDLTAAQSAGTLSIPDQSTPSTGDTPLNPAAFPGYVSGTSFATASCLIHSGELYSGSPACKLYTLTCQVGSNSEQSGALCPTSSQRNEQFQVAFDGPAFSLPDVTGTNGLTYHQGVGFLEAAEGWGGGSCKFDQNSAIAQQLCPQNILTSFSGPGGYKGGGSGQSPNSTFIPVAPVPEALTTVSVTGLQPGNWINTHSPTVNFVSTPPAISSNNNFIASPIETLTYGISTASSVPQPPAPVPNDTILSNNGACPAPEGSAPANVFTPPAQSVSVPADGNYELHYYAEDCAGTEELKFLQSGGSWSTAFYTFPINVDTVNPLVASGPTLSPPPSTNNGVANSYVVGQPVTATYSCSDNASPIVNSGVVKCGTATFPVGTLNTGTVSSPVSTSSTGSQSFTVNAVDAAGNSATPASVMYQVVAAPPAANLSVLKVAPATVKHGAQLIYAITALNLGKQAASAVKITDPLPSGVTFVKASAQQLACSGNKCSNDASCAFASNTVTCSVPSLTLLTPVLVEIYVNVTANAGTTVSNTATVSSANPPGKGVTQSTAKTTVK